MKMGKHKYIFFSLEIAHVYNKTTVKKCKIWERIVKGKKIQFFFVSWIGEGLYSRTEKTSAIINNLWLYKFNYFCCLTIVIIA